ncbi:MAG: amino acid adenylation domain-containing protein [Nitrospirales bacterium]
MLEDTSTLGSASSQTHVPLSYAQERFWVLDQLYGKSQRYYLSRAFRMKGSLHELALNQSFQTIVNRHEILRTTFPSVNGSPRQVVSPIRALSIPVVELPHNGEATREVEGIHMLVKEEARPLDLVHGPLWRVTLVRFDPQDHLLILVMHHIISDGWSMEILFDELSKLYSEYCQDRKPSFPALSFQYSDFTRWQREYLNGQVGGKELAYWQKTLEDVPPLLPLPTDYPRGPMESFHGGQVLCLLPERLNSKITLVKQRTGSSFFMVLLATLQLFLFRYTGSSDILVGAPTAGRNRPEHEPLIGCFLNNLVFRTRFSKPLTFNQLLGQVRQTVFGALAHQEIPFEKLLDTLPVERQTGRAPLFQVFLNMHNFSNQELSLPGLHTRVVVSPDVKAHFDWTLYFQEKPDQVQLTLTYNAALFAESRMKEVLNQLQGLLDQVVQDPDLPLYNYSLVTTASCRFLPDPTLSIEEPHQEDVCSLIHHHAKSLPDHVAVSQDTRTWSYQELVNQANALSHTLQNHGLQSGEVVAIGGPRSFGLIVALLGVLQAGGVMMLLDPRLPVERQCLMRQVAKAKRYVWIGQGLPHDLTRDAVSDIAIHQVNPETGRVLDQRHHDSMALGGDCLPYPLQPHAPAYIFFTSGTTGSPKGILGQRKSLNHFLNWQTRTFQVGPQDRVAQLTSLSFDSVLRDIFLPLINGATLCLPDNQLERDPTQVIPWIAQERITILHAVPTVSQFWLQHVPKNATRSSLRWTFFSGEPLTDVFVNRWRQSLPESGRLVNFYGPTETTMIKCWSIIPDPPFPGIQPIGFPLPQTQALVVGPEADLCGIGELGEIVLRTSYGTLGYLNATQEQQQRFRPNPYRDDTSDRWYFTGDRGRYRLDGSLDILGRMDNQIKIRGVRIEPEEITSILQTHPDLQAAAVVGHKEKDGDNNVLIAYVVAHGNAPLTEQSIRTFLSKKVPAAMIPSSFVFLNSLPLTHSGKLDRRALPATPLTFSNPKMPFVEPRTPAEHALTQILREILSVERIGINDNFFELGGHSLLAMQAINRIETTFRTSFPLRHIFEAPTIADWAQHLDGMSNESQSSHIKPHSFQDRDEGLI